VCVECDKLGRDYVEEVVEVVGKLLLVGRSKASFGSLR
jgi:hypothetical protein